MGLRVPTSSCLLAPNTKGADGCISNAPAVRLAVLDQMSDENGAHSAQYKPIREFALRHGADEAYSAQMVHCVALVSTWGFQRRPV